MEAAYFDLWMVRLPGNDVFDEIYVVRSIKQGFRENNLKNAWVLCSSFKTMLNQLLNSTLAVIGASASLSCSYSVFYHLIQPFSRCLIALAHSGSYVNIYHNLGNKEVISLLYVGSHFILLSVILTMQLFD